MRRRDLAWLGGVTKGGGVPRAEIQVGLRVGKRTRQAIIKTVGASIPQRRAVAALVKLRAAQVGKDEAAHTITRCQGMFAGLPERSLRCEIAPSGSAGERTVRTFERHMADLAEDLAAVLGQREVHVWLGSDRIRATPRGEPAPRPRWRGERIVR